jgi:hypothetical protein
MDRIQQGVDDIYREVAAFYKEKCSEMGELAVGYEILHGPAIACPKTIFIGFQPGGWIDTSGSETGIVLQPPERFVSAYKTWRYAKKMQEIWGADYLEQCNGLDAIFFRARSMREWYRLNPSLRQDLKQFSEERARRLVDLLDPQQLVVIGLHTFATFGEISRTVLSGSCRLVVEGTLWGRPALGTAHLSGARLKKDDWPLLRKHFASA